MVFLLIVIVIVVVTILIIKNNKQTEQEPIAQNADIDIDALYEEVEQMKLKTQVFIQADIVGDEQTKAAINNGTYNGPWPEERSDGGYLSLYDNLRILKIAGINYRTGIDHYVGRVDCALVPEPQNEFDPNAIKIVAADRHHLGYIPSDQTDFVRSLAADKFPMQCLAIINEGEDEDDGHKFYYGFVYIRKRE